MAIKLSDIQAVVRDRTGYNVMTAIRGPDTEALGLKKVFTERLRYLAGCGEFDDSIGPYSGGTFRAAIRDTKSISSSELSHAYAEAQEEGGHRNAHYLGHMIEAFRFLESLLTDEEQIKEVKALSQLAHEFRYRYDPILSIVKFARDLGLDVVY